VVASAQMKSFVIGLVPLFLLMLSQDGAMVSGRFCSWPEVCHPPFPEAVPSMRCPDNRNQAALY
jgi:hypothetical protein